jgi:uncharacterized protein involved in exopolysaccharide biosynthesis
VEEALMVWTKWLRVLRRWLWLIAVVVVVTAGVLALWLASTTPTYEATAKIGLPTLPERRVASFLQVLNAEPVRQQTINQLGLEGAAAEYELDVKNLGNAGFLELTVVTDDANRAAQIANAHSDAAVAYFGVLRAQPAEEELRVLAEQLDEAREELTAAEQAFAEFRTEHGIGSLKERLVQYERHLGDLRADRDQQAMAGLSTFEIDETIARISQQLRRLTGLAPSYNALEDAVAQAQKVFNQAHTKYVVADLALTTAQATDDIEVVEPARAPAQPVSVPKKLFAMGLAGAVGLGIGLALALESVFPSDRLPTKQKR